MTTWTTPDSVNDPENQWANEAKTIDGDTGTYGNDVIPRESWSAWLEFYLTDTCDGLRFYPYKGPNVEQAKIEIYYGDTWHEVYNQVYNHKVWNNVAFVAVAITKARLAFYNKGTTSSNGYLYEFEFNVAGEPPPPANRFMRPRKYW